MTTASLTAWRTELYLDVRADVDPVLLTALLRQQVGMLDAAASRFREDSQVTRLHRRAGQWTEVSPLLQRLLRVAVQVAEQTDGLVHPGLGAVVASAGYDRWLGTGRQPAAAGRPKVLPWQAIEFQPGGAVRIPPGMIVDLGATAKAWLADTLATVVHEATGAAVLANMGGDIRAISTGVPWTVWLDPELPGAPAVPVAAADAGIATSGLSRRRWPGGHHIIDPRTALPADTCWWSASVIAADAVAANAAATAAMVLGPQAPGWLAEHRLTARLVDGDGNDTSIGWRRAA